eukprot:2793022-Rhodomonas_salina.1
MKLGLGLKASYPGILVPEEFLVVVLYPGTGYQSLGIPTRLEFPPYRTRVPPRTTIPVPPYPRTRVLLLKPSHSLERKHCVFSYPGTRVPPGYPGTNS